MKIFKISVLFFILVVTQGTEVCAAKVRSPGVSLKIPKNNFKITASSVKKEGMMEIVLDGQSLSQNKASADTIYYHNWYQTGSWSDFPYFRQQPWVFVRFSPTAQQIADDWTFAGLYLRYHYSFMLPTPQCTIGVWNTNVSIPNLKAMWTFWDTSSSGTCIVDNGRFFDLDGDFWIGYCEVGCAGGDTIIPCVDNGTNVPGRNYYSIADAYGAMTEYTAHNMIITAFIKLEAGIEENSNLKSQTSKLNIAGNKICLSVPNEISAELKLYDLCGRMKEIIYSGTLETGNYTFTPRIRTSGIYFVELVSGDYKETRKLILMK